MQPESANNPNDLNEISEICPLVEALLFSASNALSSEDIASALKSASKELGNYHSTELGKLTTTDIEQAISQLIKSYATENRSFTLIERPRGWKISALPEFAAWAKHLYPNKKASRLSQPALETLSIIAYRQPISKAGIESVRGVAVDGVMQTLLEKELIAVSGRADLPGRPILYSTTESFLDYFGVKQVDDLPNFSELHRLSDAEKKASAKNDAQETANSQQLKLAEQESSQANS